jgi:hypothetical protein
MFVCAPPLMLKVNQVTPLSKESGAAGWPSLSHEWGREEQRKSKPGARLASMLQRKLNALQLLLTRAIEPGTRNAMRPSPRVLNAAAPAVVAISVRAIQTIKSKAQTWPLNGGLE